MSTGEQYVSGWVLVKSQHLTAKSRMTQSVRVVWNGHLLRQLAAHINDNTYKTFTPKHEKHLNEQEKSHSVAEWQSTAKDTYTTTHFTEKYCTPVNRLKRMTLMGK